LRAAVPCALMLVAVRPRRGESDREAHPPSKLAAWWQLRRRPRRGSPVAGVPPAERLPDRPAL